MSQLVPFAGELSPVGMRLPEGLDFDEWLAIGEQIVRAESATQWALADWLFYGEWAYGRRYEEALELTGLAYGTLANLKYVAGRFDASRRREKLSLAHHQNVASLPPAEADRWLDRAEQGSWPHARLRDEIASSFAATGSKDRGSKQVRVLPSVQYEQLSLQLDLDRSEQWALAADDRGMPLAAWVVTVCDEAAAA